LIRLHLVVSLCHEAKGVLSVKKLYVGNLPFQATEQDLISWFTQAGVTGPQVTLVRDQLSGQLRGFGFVEVPNDEEAGRAIEALNGQDFMGRSVVVNEARPKAAGGGGGRGGYGGGGGQGRGGGGGRDSGGRGGGGRDRRY
jgi:RNA recognition motif-containing protein